MTNRLKMTIDCVKRIVKLLPIHSLELHTMACTCSVIRDYITILYPDDEEGAFRLWSPLLVAKSPRFLSLYDSHPMFRDVGNSVTAMLLFGLIERKDDDSFFDILQKIPREKLDSIISVEHFVKAIEHRQSRIFRHLITRHHEAMCHRIGTFSHEYFIKMYGISIIKTNQWHEFEWLCNEITWNGTNGVEIDLIEHACEYGNVAIFENLMNKNGRPFNHGSEAIIIAMVARSPNVELLVSCMNYFDTSRTHLKGILFGENMRCGFKSIAEYLKQSLLTDEEFNMLISEPSCAANVGINPNLEMMEWYIDHCKSPCWSQLLTESLKKGYLPMIKLILSKASLPIPAHAYIESTRLFLTILTFNEPREALEWLIEKGIPYNNGDLDLLVLAFGNIEMIKCIAEHNIIIPSSAINLCITKNKFEWLVLFYKHSNFTPNHEMFELAVKKGRLQIMKWLYELGYHVFDTPTIIAAKKNIRGCKNQAISRWLCSVNPSSPL